MPSKTTGLQTTGTGSGLARHRCTGLRYAPATTWGLATTPDSLIKGGPLRSGWSVCDACFGYHLHPSEAFFEFLVFVEMLLEHTHVAFVDCLFGWTGSVEGPHNEAAFLVDAPSI